MNKDTLIKNIEKILLSDYENNINQIGKNDSKKLRKIRENALSQFIKLGFPSTKEELWRFTDIKKIIENSGRLLQPFTPPKDINSPVEDVFQCDATQLDTYDIALINGWYPHSLPLMQELPSKGKVGSLYQAKELFPELIDKYYAKYIDYSDNPFTALNTAFAHDGVFCYFPENSKNKKPVQIVNLASANKITLTTPFIQTRNLIIAEKNSDVKIVICEHTLSNNNSFSNSVTEIIVEENANVELIRIQNQNNFGVIISDIQVHQKANSSFTSNTITLNGGLVRNNQNIQLNGKKATANIYGAYFIDKAQHIDNYTKIEHKVPECNSNELFKGILDEKAEGVFRGMIKVNKNAQKTNSFQKNNNLLLTSDAQINTMPQLEIYADDVKCNHGATIGYLDDEEMFYLLSRGINKKEARLLLMNAFASEIIEKISIPVLKGRISFLVNQRLRGELLPCASCALNCNI
ncbi:MAG: Fe-S cluster assembly protein SufD [Bacteroidota bacterium]|nr:Fe-S cluster assembly protein SufD [Bacteroidota bacterium]